MLGRLSWLARLAAQRSDVVVAIFMMLSVVMMVIPLPTAMVDVLIAINIALSLLTLIVAFYVSHPVEFSALPPIILLGTLFRLALSITTTRLILLHADAGQIVATFGDFVIGGEVVVGLVIFLIITTAQFIVITKGAERVAEVAARFTLDAMPGKQMSIDNDLRNGDIEQAEARRRRSRLERESQLYGAMDGAMKFVKGDAIAGLVIVFVNLIGGLLIGIMQRGMTFADAAHTYSLLTVGDGLIAQIPALLIAIAAGTVVTRVASDVEGDLGSEIVRQLGANEKALALAAVILFMTGFVPGFPMLVFFALAAILGGFAWRLHRSKMRTRPPVTALVPAASTAAEDEFEAETVILSGGQTRHRVIAFVGAGLFEAIPAERFRAEADHARQALNADLGVEVPAVEMRLDRAMAPDRFRIDLEGVPVMEGELPAGGLMLHDDPMHLELLQIPFRNGPPLLRRRRSVWIDGEHAGAMREAGIGYVDTAGTLGECCGQTLRRYAAHFVGIQETRELLTEMEGDYAELVKEAVRVVPLQKLSDILRRLVEEDVPVRNLRAVLEALVEWAPREGDTTVLTERVRASLGRQICHRYAEMNRVLTAYVLARSTEDLVRGAMKQTGVGLLLALPEDASRSIVTQLRREIDAAGPEASPTVVVSMEIRRVLRNLLIRNDIDIPVLSYQEIAPEFSVQALASISLPTDGNSRRQRPIGQNRTPDREATPLVEKTA